MGALHEFAQNWPHCNFFEIDVHFMLRDSVAFGIGTVVTFLGENNLRSMGNEPSRFNFASSKLIYQLANSHQFWRGKFADVPNFYHEQLIQTFTTAWVCMKAPDYIWLKWCWRGVTVTKLNALFLIYLYCCWNADKSWNGLIALIATGKYHPRPMASKGRSQKIKMEI